MLRPFVFVALAAASGLAGAQTFFYGGDADLVNGLISGKNLTGGGMALTYDDFNLGATTDIGTIFGNFLMSPAYTTASITQAYYEIRTGMSDGNGGTLVASGTVAATATNVGNQGLGLKEFLISAHTNFNLNAGTYWVSLAPVGDGIGSIFVATTHGANSIGAPIGNDNSFYNAFAVYSDISGHAFEKTSYELGGTSSDFSYGLAQAPSTPEPASLAVLGLGVIGLVRRRRLSR